MILTCGNATENHQMPLLVIGKSKKPQCFKKWKTLPVIYTSRKKAWINMDIFIDWYGNTFIPKIKEHQKNLKKPGRVLLILDNVPSHPCEDTLECENSR